MTHTISIDLPLEKISEICRRYSVAESAVFGLLLVEN